MTELIEPIKNLLGGLDWRVIAVILAALAGIWRKELPNVLAWLPKLKTHGADASESQRTAADLVAELRRLTCCAQPDAREAIAAHCDGIDEELAKL